MRRPLRSENGRELANLAIDLGDPGRMARARRLHRGGAVGPVQIDDGTLSAVVFDDADSCDASLSIALPYRGSSEVPDAGAVERTSCSCDVDPGPCKHVLALLLSFAEEVEAEPSLLSDWTSPAQVDAPAGASADRSQDSEFLEGPWTDDLEPFVLTELHPLNDVALSVEGVDAWPAIRDAIEVAAEARSAS